MKTLRIFLFSTLVLWFSLNSASAQSAKLDSLQRAYDALEVKLRALEQEYNNNSLELRNCKTDAEIQAKAAERNAIDKKAHGLARQSEKLEREMYLEKAHLKQQQREADLARKQAIKQGGNTAATRGVLNGHEWVDLGLPSGTKWATCNVGATKPHQAGLRVAWGEVKPKKSYSEHTWKGYLYTNQELGDIAGNAKYDAATANWGEGWTMPTLKQWEELREHCSWEFTVQDGIEGALFVSYENANYIFLPCAGYTEDDKGKLIHTQYNGAYWSSTPIGQDGANTYIFCPPTEYPSTSYRCSALSVRAVYGTSGGATTTKVVTKSSVVTKNSVVTNSSKSKTTTEESKTTTEEQKRSDANKRTAETVKGAIKSVKSLKSLFRR